MKCAWNELLSILPLWMRDEVDRLGKEKLQELRLRIGDVPQLILGEKRLSVNRGVVPDDINYVVNTASRYSPWAATTAAQGYITAPGGHRIGICGQAVMQDGSMTGVRYPESLCIRVARDFPGVALRGRQLDGNVLIIGPPGSGKTTFLRDLIRQKAHSKNISVVDDRCEIFPKGFYRGINIDVLSGSDKETGIVCLIRTMSPDIVAADEITSEKDCMALQKACWCGVNLLATAHAGSVEELKKRTIYSPIIKNGVFDYVIVLQKDKSWHVERVGT